MPRFIKGLELSRQFYNEVVRPILQKHDRNLAYAAGLIGRGSEVLGYDDKMSTDHDWGPTVTIFLNSGKDQLVPVIAELMRHELPHHFKGYSTNFIFVPEAPDTQVMAITTRGAINHQVRAVTIDQYFQHMLGWDGMTPINMVDWLTFPSQKLRALTSGAVFHDGEGELTRIRAQLAWYPDDIWLYLMAAQWDRIGQEEHLMGRAGQVGDELGATVIAGRLINDMMRLYFLMEREYAPYAKWFGTAFQELDGASVLAPMLRQMQLADNWETCQTAYAHAIEFITDKHNQLNITETLRVAVKKFYTRPFLVSDAGNIAQKIRLRITHPEIHALASLPTQIGSIDQITDETTLKEDAEWRQRLLILYDIS